MMLLTENFIPILIRELDISDTFDYKETITIA
jgi:hypothetical protein